LFINKTRRPNKTQKMSDAAAEWTPGGGRRKTGEDSSDSSLSSYMASAMVGPSNQVNSVRSPLLPGNKPDVLVNTHYGSSFTRQLSQDSCSESRPRGDDFSEGYICGHWSPL